MIDTMTERSWLSFENRSQSTADALISSVCNLSRIELLADSLCVALETLAASQPDWLLKTALPHWFDRYTKRKLLSDLPTNLPEQCALAQAIGLDAAHLLGAVEHEAGLAQLREIRLLQRVYSGQFDFVGNKAFWRPPQCVGCNLAA